MSESQWPSGITAPGASTFGTGANFPGRRRHAPVALRMEHGHAPEPVGHVEVAVPDAGREAWRCGPERIGRDLNDAGRPGLEQQAPPRAGIATTAREDAA